jgi:uncharacterized membrane protein (DUF106 family)
MKKFVLILSAIFGAILTILLSQKKSDRDMSKLKKVSRESDKRVKEWKEKTKVSEAKANESIDNHYGKFGNNVDDVIGFIERGKN